MKKFFNWTSLRTRVTALTLIVCAICVWAYTIYGSRMLRSDMQQQLGKQQYSTVSLVASHIDEGLSERLSAIERIAAEVTPQMVSIPTQLQTLLDNRPLLELLFNGGVFATDSHGTAIADFPKTMNRIGVNYMDRETVSDPLMTGKSIIGKPAMGKMLQAPIFSISAPLRDASGNVFGTLVGTINLGKPNFLDKITNGQYGNTGGFLLFAPQHKLIVTATDKSRVLQSSPSPGANSMHDKYADGFEGFGVAVSSRGVEELSAAKRIPTAGWFLVATLPTKEAFATVDTMQRQLGIAAAAVTLLGGILIWLFTRQMLRQQLGPILVATRKLQMTDDTQPVQPLPVTRLDEIGELLVGFNRLTDTLAQREDMLKQILDTASVGIFLVDKSGRLAKVNRQMAIMFGRPIHAMEGQEYVSLLPPPEREVQSTVVIKWLNGTSNSADLDRLYWREDQSTFLCHLTGNRFFDPNGVDRGFIGVISDVTERRSNEERLLLAFNVFTHAREGIMITDANANIREVNDSFSRITGYARDEVIGKNPRFLSSGRQTREFYGSLWQELTGQGHWSGEIWNRRKNGDVFPESITISAVRDSGGITQQYVGLFSDITPAKDHERELERIAHFDTLTSLPNRALLADRLHQAMAHAQRRRQVLAVAFIDLDGFKAINDRYGHDHGDLMLVAVAGAMKDTLRQGDTLARMGGDEFVAVLIDLESVADALPMLDRLLAAAAQVVPAGDFNLQVSASVGVTFFPQTDDVDADQLLRQADQGMYQAKLAGKNRYHVFDSEQDRSVRGHHESLERIRKALADAEFVLHFQPKVNMRTGEVIGVEALIRWQHPERGLLSPAEFLPVIENHPLAISVGEWVIGTTLNQIERWREQGLDMRVSVNVGARQLLQHDFADRLQAMLASHPDVLPDHLELEILETSALEDVWRASDVIEACSQIGVTFALDDFGTGYSSLAYLKRLRVKVIKIDQSFVCDMIDDPDDRSILEGVIGLAAAFRREVIAEGVETTEHGTLLLHLGCELAQGYCIGRPMPAGEIRAWVASWQPESAWTDLPWLGGEISF